MASELEYDKLVKLVKSENDITQGKAAERLGLSIGQVPMLKFCQAKVEAGAVSKAPGTESSIKKLRANGDRFEMIAAKTGKSVAAVKEVLGDNAGYVGRGRNFNGASSGAARKSSSKTASTGSRKTTSTGTARKKTASTSTGTARKKTASTGAARKRGSVVRNTRRSSGATNPS